MADVDSSSDSECLESLMPCGQCTSLKSTIQRQVDAYQVLNSGNLDPILNMVIRNLQDILARFQDSDEKASTDHQQNDRKSSKHKKGKEKKQPKKNVDTVVEFKTVKRHKRKRGEQDDNIPVKKRNTTSVDDGTVAQGSKMKRRKKAAESATRTSTKKSKKKKQREEDVEIPFDRESSPAEHKFQNYDQPLVSPLPEPKQEVYEDLMKIEPEEQINYDVVEVSSSEDEFDEISSTTQVEASIIQVEVWNPVFKWLNWVDLKNCRLVHSTFKRLATEELLERDLCIVRFKFDVQSRLYHHDSSWKWKNPSQIKSLSDLNEMLEYTSLFPSTNFNFQGGDLTRGGAQEFFKNHGTLVKTLDIQFDPSKATTTMVQQERLQELLLDETPNINTLKMSYFPHLTSWPTSKRLCPSSLETLICTSNCSVNFERPQSTALAMLSSDLRKLKNVYNFKAQYLPLFNSKSQIQKIKSYRLEIFEVDTTVLMDFANSGVRLESLTVYYPSQESKSCKTEAERQEKECQAANALNKLLRSSHKSLRRLDTTTLRLLDRKGNILSIPPLDNLTQLTLLRRWIETEPNEAIVPCFPLDTKFRIAFPNLKIVNMFLSGFRNEYWSQYFPPGLVMEDQFPTVTTLGLGGYFTDLWFKNLRVMFPNVKRLVNTCLSGVRYMAMDRTINSICKYFEDVEELEFLGCTWWLLSYKVVGNVSYDVAFTGILQVDCDKIKWTKMDDMPDINEFKRFQSITDLKNLKKLKIRISNQTWALDSIPRFDLITRISGIYAFRLMPHLQIVISYHQFCPSAAKISEGLVSVAPYVHTIMHESHEDHGKLCGE